VSDLSHEQAHGSNLFAVVLACPRDTASHTDAHTHQLGWATGGKLESNTASNFTLSLFEQEKILASDIKERRDKFFSSKLQIHV
jgi:hypothetical protein